MEAQMLIRTIARGRDGARSLDPVQAFALFDALLDGRLSAAQRAAVLIALRVKGESLDEVDAAMRALAPRVNRVAVDCTRPAVAIPSYNGARRLANLTPLLACLLADAGVQVVVHGVAADAARTTTAEIFQAMGIPLVDDISHASAVIARQTPVFVPVASLSPALATLLALRDELGVRNIGHTLAKLLNPTDAAGCLRLVSFTHPEFDRLQHDYFLRTGEPALVMRGTEGEAVASTRRAARIDLLAGGTCETLLDAQPRTSPEAPALPDAADAHATAAWIQSVLAGEHPVPAAIEQQVACVLHALDADRSAVAAA